MAAYLFFFLSLGYRRALPKIAVWVLLSQSHSIMLFIECEIQTVQNRSER